MFDGKTTGMPFNQSLTGLKLNWFAIHANVVATPYASRVEIDLPGPSNATSGNMTSSVSLLCPKPKACPNS